MLKKNLSFDDFENVYFSIDELPKRSEDRISDSFKHAFSSGFECLFSELAQFQPDTFESIKDNLNEICILENVVRGRGVFWLGLNLNEYLLLGPLNSHLNAAQLNCLPNELSGYYQHQDGFDFPVNDYPGLLGRRMPRMLNGWPLIEDACRERGVAQKALSVVKHNFGHANFRVWIESINCDLFLVDFARLDRKIYHVKDYNFDTMSELLDSIQTVDRYCASVLAGKDSEFVFPG